MTPIDQFSHHHWSLLAYIEARCVNQELIEPFRLRCSPKNKYLGGPMIRPPWDPAYGTALRDGTILPDHDDWDCLDDLEENGFIVIESTISGIVKLTDLGIKTVHRIREHKIRGGEFSNFVFAPEIGL